MVRVRVKILDHEGASKKKDLIECISGAEAYVNKIVSSKEAFFLITDNCNMDKLLGEEVKQRLMAVGLEIQHPPEYEAARTVMLKNVDDQISQLTEGEIASLIETEYRVKRVIKIPNNNHLVKVIFDTAATADKAVKVGITVQFQRFEGKGIEKEEFISVVPCYRCYSYAHQKRNCIKPVDYKICSNCASEGHTYGDCKSVILRCINCTGDHRTLAAKCPERKAIIKRKIKERRMSKSATREGVTTTKMTLTPEVFKKMPDNYLAVMAATIMIADNREAETPGSFQYVANEMLKANKIPIVTFPESVKKKNIQQKYGQKGKEEQEQETRKRPRSNEGSEAASVRTTVPRIEDDYVLLADGTWCLRSALTPTSTPRQTPAPTPINTPTHQLGMKPLSLPRPLAQTSTHTTAITPTVTPVPSPAASPARSTGAVLKTSVTIGPQTAPQAQSRQQQQPKQQREKEQDPKLIVIVRSDITLPENMTSNQIKKELTKEKIMKFVYTNVTCNPEIVKKNMNAGKYELTRIRKLYLAPEYYHQIKSGGAYKGESLEKLVRK